jgi:tetratricopeptide (TPR) repeat protein
VPLVHNARSEQALTQNDTKEALAAALTAVELDRSNPRFMMQVGRVHEARIREARLITKVIPDESIFRAAIEAFEKADEIAGGSVLARLERARVLATWGGHGDEAEEAYRDVVQLAKEQGDTRVIYSVASAAEEAEAAARRSSRSCWRSVRTIPRRTCCTRASWSGSRRLRKRPATWNRPWRTGSNPRCCGSS